MFFELLGRIAKLVVIISLLMGCAKQPGPDKTVAGAVLGAGWGAGAGAIVGHQLSYAGEGAAVGAGLGAVSGALTGYAHDTTEETQIAQERQLASLKVQNLANERELAKLQDKFDNSVSSFSAGGIYQVFFEPDATSLKAGAIANLETVADALKRDSSVGMINVDGHADDSNTPDYNERLSESRARAVSAYLGARGISMDKIRVRSFGSKRPLASNSTEVGQQLNRRVDISVDRIG